MFLTVNQMQFQDVTLSWQQKIFSRSEVDFYSRSRVSDFENDVLKKKFYHDVQAQMLIREAAAIVPGHSSSSHNQQLPQICTEIDGEFANDFDLVSERPIPFLQQICATIMKVFEISAMIFYVSSE